jgi:hypothetical protein
MGRVSQDCGGNRAQKEVIAGGRRRVPPATHVEWQVRRATLKELVTWGFG